MDLVSLQKMFNRFPVFLRTFAVNAVLFVGLLLIFLWAVSIFLNKYTQHDLTISVPDLEGLSLEEAQNMLAENELRAEVLDSIFDAKFQPSLVLESNPKHNTKVKKGRVIYLTINAGQVPKVKMPNLIDKDIKQAIIIIESLGLVLGNIKEIPDIAQDLVLQQYANGRTIAPDNQIVVGTVIDLEIGDGSFGADPTATDQETEIPMLEELTYDEALIVLRAKGFNLGKVSTKGRVTDTASAKIVAQIPEYEEGKLLMQGSYINITIKQ